MKQVTLAQREDEIKVIFIFDHVNQIEEIGVVCDFE